MAYKVVFYSRSGYSRKIAEQLATGLGCECLEITDGRDWRGMVGLIRAGYYSSTGKDVTITVHGSILPDDDVIAVSPVWAGKVMPAIRMFLKDHPRDKVRYVATSNGTGLRDRDGFKSVTDVIRSRKDAQEVVEIFLKDLSSV